MMILGTTKTCLYNVDYLKPHFYTVKLGFTWVYFIFLISVGTRYNRLAEADLTSIYNLCVSRNMKNIRIFIRKFSVFGGKSFSIFEYLPFIDLIYILKHNLHDMSYPVIWGNKKNIISLSSAELSRR